MVDLLWKCTFLLLDLLRVLFASQKSHCLWLTKASCILPMKWTHLNRYHVLHICNLNILHKHTHTHIHIYMYAFYFSKKFLNMQIFPHFIIIRHFSGFLWWFFSPALISIKFSTKCLNHHHSTHSLSDYLSCTKPWQKSKQNKTLVLNCW